MVQKKLKAKALLIDLDGTLVDSSEAFDEAANMAFSEIDYRRGFRRKGLGVEIARLLQRNLPLDEFFSRNDIDLALRENFLDHFLQSFYTIATTRTELLPDVDEALRELSKSYTLALITRRHVPKRLVEKELQRLRIGSFFATIITALDVEKPTPSPDAIFKAAEELRVSVQDCVVISDSGVDIQAGKLAGAKTVAILSGLFNEDELRREMPDLIIETVSRLPGCLLPK